MAETNPRIQVAVLTVSDRSARGDRVDASGPALRDRLSAAGYEVVTTEVVADDRHHIATQLRALSGRVQLIVTTGGTGLAPRDVTPEATGDVPAIDMIRQLVEDHGIVVASARKLFAAAEEAGDQASADLAVRRIDVHEKAAWMLRSHLEG